MGRSSRQPSLLLFAAARLSARASARPAVVADIHGRLRSGDERDAYRHRRGSRQARQRGSGRRRISRFATILWFEKRRHTTHAPGNPRTLPRCLWRQAVRAPPPEWIEALLDSKPPHAARSWRATLRSLCQFAVKRRYRRDDPTANIKLRAIKGDGFHTWTDDEIAQFEAHHPVGTKPRLALALLLYTMQRRSDVIRMGRQHLSDCLDERLRAQGVRNMLSVRQQKTGKPLVIPVRPDLQVVIDATPSEHLTFLVTATGKPYGGNALSEQFRDWCDAAGLPQRCKPHGLRKAGLRRGAEDGWSANELAAWSGHASLREVERYTRAADQARLARNALARAVIR